MLDEPDSSQGGSARRIRMQIVMTSPEFAAELLSRRTCNRPVNRGNVSALAESMVCGRWQLTHQGIALDGPLETGAVIDGQHRLHAVVMANTTVPMMVFENMSRETLPVLDTGRRRSAADTLSLSGEKDAGLLASTVRHVHLYLSLPNAPWTGPKARMSNDQVLETLAKDPDGYRRAAAVGRRLGAQIHILPTAAAVGYYVTVGGSTSATWVEEWLSGLASGADLPQGDARLALRNAMTAPGRSSRRRRSTRPQAGLYVKAWNHWVEGNDVSKLAMPKNGKLPQPLRPGDLAITPDSSRWRSQSP
ncbi:hypothetical protein [Streptomyces murinus]|uniref:hypothetical protein n=1 Tax=Streptomyces murinus TaxID=33900 RepID=UPI00341199C5